MPKPKRSLPGRSTIQARVDGEYISELLVALGRLRGQGTSEEDLRDMMRGELTYFDEHSIDRILEWSHGRRSDQDDVPEEIVEDVAAPKQDTRVVRLRKLPPVVGLRTLLRFRGKDYIVVRIDETEVTLKEIRIEGGPACDGR